MDKSLILKEIKNSLNFKTDTEFANFLGIKQNTLSTWKNRNIIDYDLIISKCENINANWLITGRGSMLREQEEQAGVKQQATGTVKNRLKEFIRYKRLNVLKFEKSINASNGYVNSITKGIGGNYLKKIEEVYEDLNINWLLYGEGDMFGKNNQININGTNTINNSVLQNEGSTGNIKVIGDSQTETYKILLAEKDKLISEYKTQITEKDKQLSEKDKQISEKDIQISKLIELLPKK